MVGTEIEGVYFNRQGENGSPQSMCAFGKKKIDTFQQNKLRRLCVSICSAIFYENKKIQLRNDGLNKRVIQLCENINNQINKNEKLIKLFLENKNEENYLNLLKNLYKTLLSSKIQLYLPTTIQELEEVENTIEKINEEYKDKNQKITNEILNTGRYYALESSTKNNEKQEYNKVQNLKHNLSKTQTLYEKKGDSFIKTEYKVPLHNTVVKSSSTGNNRQLKYFSFEGDSEKADKKIKQLKKEYSPKIYHIDHMFPLALGGLHDPNNLEPMEKKLNREKLDSLTFEIYLKAKKDPFSHISSYVMEDFRQMIILVQDDKEKFNKYRVEYEKKFKLARIKRIEQFKNKSKIEQLEELQNKKPHYNKEQIEVFLQRVLRNLK